MAFRRRQIAARQHKGQQRDQQVCQAPIPHHRDEARGGMSARQQLAPELLSTVKKVVTQASTTSPPKIVPPRVRRKVTLSGSEAARQWAASSSLRLVRELRLSATFCLGCSTGHQQNHETCHEAGQSVLVDRRNHGKIEPGPTWYQQITPDDRPCQCRSHRQAEEQHDDHQRPEEEHEIGERIGHAEGDGLGKGPREGGTSPALLPCPAPPRNSYRDSPAKQRLRRVSGGTAKAAGAPHAARALRIPARGAIDSGARLFPSSRRAAVLTVPA